MRKNNLILICLEQRGISIIEVLVAILITAVGILALAHLQSTSINANYIAYKKQNAIFLAKEYLEKAVVIAVNNDIELQGKIIKANVGNIFYTVSTSIVNGNCKGTKNVMVEVKWEDSSVDLNTIISPDKRVL